MYYSYGITSAPIGSASKKDITHVATYVTANYRKLSL
jgi:hypothetical protein